MNAAVGAICTLGLIVAGLLYMVGRPQKGGRLALASIALAILWPLGHGGCGPCIATVADANKGLLVLGLFFLGLALFVSGLGKFKKKLSDAKHKRDEPPTSLKRRVDRG